MLSHNRITTTTTTRTSDRHALLLLPFARVLPVTNDETRDITLLIAEARKNNSLLRKPGAGEALCLSYSAFGTSVTAQNRTGAFREEMPPGKWSWDTDVMNLIMIGA